MFYLLKGDYNPHVRESGGVDPYNNPVIVRMYNPTIVLIFIPPLRVKRQ